MTSSAIIIAIALLNFNLFVNAYKYKYIEMASEASAKQVALFRCTVNAEIEVNSNQPSPVSGCACKTITSKSEQEQVYSSVNFYRVMHPKMIREDVTITFNGTPWSGPVSLWAVGDDFPDPRGLSNWRIFQPIATEYIFHLELLFSKRLTPYLPEGDDGRRLIQITARYFALNDMAAFSDAPDVTKGYLGGFVTVLQHILRAEAEKTTVSAKSRRISRIPKIFRRIPRIPWFGRRKPQPVAVNTVNTDVQAVVHFKSIMVMFVQKMFDPCVVLNFNSKSGDAETIHQYCKTYCEFLTLAVKRLSLEVPSECTDMQHGQCDENKFCICYRQHNIVAVKRRMSWKKPRPPTGMKMIFCDNKIRLTYLLS